MQSKLLGKRRLSLNVGEIEKARPSDLQEILRVKLNAYHNDEQKIETHDILPSPLIDKSKQQHKIQIKKEIEAKKKQLTKKNEVDFESFAIRKRSSLVMSGECRDRTDSISAMQKVIGGFNEASKPFASPRGLSPDLMA